MSAPHTRPDAAAVWRSLTPIARRALVDPLWSWHGNTIRGLVQRGLLNEDRTHTERGRYVVAHRPYRYEHIGRWP